MTKEKRRMSKLKIAGLILLFLSAIAIGGGIGYVQHLNSLIERLDTNEFDKQNIVKNEEVEEVEEYTTIAVFGVDARNQSLGEGNRSDSIMLATINNKTKEVKLTSIYRDTLVQIPEHGYDKLTHAYFFGGPELALSTLNQNFDLNITDYITINFAAAEEIIDLMGGVQIDVQASEVRWINGYAQSLAKEGASTTVKYLPNSGLQTLTGSQAVAYARIRYTAGGDYKRAKRQRILMDAALAKAKTSNLSDINKIIETAAGDISTNLSITEILGLAKDVFQYEIGESQGFPYHIKNRKVYTQASPSLLTSVDVPSYLYEDVKTLHYELYGEGSRSLISEASDSRMNEENGSANDELMNATEPSSTESSSESTQQSQETALINSKPYEPSAMIQTINDELKSIIQRYGN